MKTSEMEKLTRHYDKYFRQTNAVVIHPCVHEDIHIDGLLYEPDGSYPFWKLASMGASDYAMNGKNALGNRNEYMLFIDPAVDMHDKAVAIKYFDILTRTALFAHENDCFVSYGHSMEFAADDADVAGVYIELPQAVKDTGILRCRLSPFKKAICLQIVTLDKQALARLLEVGNEEFSYTYTYPEQGGTPHLLCRL